MNIINQVAYLRTSREFPEDIRQLTTQMNKTYLEIANAVNTRIIALFPTNRPAINGEEWYIEGNQKQQGFRQVFPLTVTAGSFNAVTHGIQISKPNQFKRCFGDYTDGTNSYGLIWGSPTAIGGQISFYITSTQIIPVSGAGAPTPTDGTIILEWISQV